jgi:hypothetical protein
MEGEVITAKKASEKGALTLCRGQREGQVTSHDMHDRDRKSGSEGYSLSIEHRGGNLSRRRDKAGKPWGVVVRHSPTVARRGRTSHD